MRLRSTLIAIEYKFRNFDFQIGNGVLPMCTMRTCVYYTTSRDCVVILLTLSCQSDLYGCGRDVCPPVVVFSTTYPHNNMAYSGFLLIRRQRIALSESVYSVEERVQSYSCCAVIYVIRVKWIPPSIHLNGV